METFTVATIITDITAVLTGLLGMVEATLSKIVTTPLLLFPILIGFAIVGIKVAFSVLKKVGAKKA